MKRFFTFLPLLIHLLNSSYAQQKSAIDSLKSHLNELQVLPYSPERDSNIIRTEYLLGYKLRRSDHDKSVYLLQQCMASSEKMHWHKSIANSKYVIALLNQDIGKYTESNALLYEAKEYYESLKRSKDSSEYRSAIASINSCMSSIANNYSYLGDYEKALKIHSESLKFQESIHDENEIGICYNNIAILYGMKGDLDQSLIYSHKALDISIKFNDSLDISMRWSNIGNALSLSSKFDDAILAYQKALSIDRKLDNKYGIVRSLNGLAEAYIELNDFQNALNYLLEANETNSKSGNRSSTVLTLAKIGNCYLKLNKTNEAGIWLLKALKQTDDNTESNIRAELFGFLGIYYSLSGDFENAYKYEIEKYNIKDKLHNEKVTRQLSETKSKYEYEIKELKLKEMHEIEISKEKQQLHLKEIESEKNKTQVALLFQQNKLKELSAFKMASELREQRLLNENSSAQNKLLTKDNHLKSFQSEQEKQQKYYALFGVAVLILIGIYIFNLYSKRHKLANQLSQSLIELKSAQEQLIKLEREKEAEKVRLNFSRDLHDDLGASLGSISVYSAAAKHRLNSETIHEVSNMLERISSDAQELARNVSERIWFMKAENNTIEKLIEHLQLFASSVLTANNISFEFNFDERIKHIELNSEAIKNIFLIFKEAIHNAGKYSKGNLVKFEVHYNADELQFELSDNGIGFEKLLKKTGSSNGSGHGLSNMKQRADEIEAEITITSSPQTGASINLFYHIPKNGEKERSI